MISPNKQNIKMIHINKTAGTSVVKWLLHLVDTGNKQHLTGKGSANSSHRIIEKFDDKHFYFTIVRNPYDRLASHYFHWESQGRGRNERWWRDDVKDLNDFVQNAYEYPPKVFIKERYLHKHQPEFIRPCTEWIRDFDKVKIFKTEELDKLLEFFRQYLKGKKADLDLSVDKGTKTKGLESYKDLYNEESLKIIHSIFHDDFENFGYKK